MHFSPLEITLLILLPSAIAWYMGREAGAREVLNSMKLAIEDMPDFEVVMKEDKENDEV